MAGKAAKGRRPNGASIEVAGALGGGAAKLKKKIRDIERLLKKEKLPADVRTNNERALKALQVDLKNTQFNLKAKEISKKYHMVRFFEKKKAIRKLKQATKHLEEISKTEVKKDIKKARKQVKHSEIDVAYVVLFPKTEKYISLYPNPKENDQVDASNPKAKKGMQMTEQRRREFRKEVEQLIESDRLPFAISDVVQGKAVKVDFDNQHMASEEIDAPEVRTEEPEEDDFFE
ncbi:rRNA-processing protein EFG1 [Scheffersomyces xylosifermentans]|uniref:rRNA-processing protein EFG1 n=1 Tax=Scheffersomyces xylosifermentans TaxID=1304137 RepID=UPI00315D6243